MKRLFSLVIGGMLAATCCTAMLPAVTHAVEIQPRDVILTNDDESTADNEPSLKPTFVADANEDEQSLRLWVGRNLLLAGNNFTSEAEVPSGLMLMAGNSLNLRTRSEYGFLFGNVIDFSGTTEKDLYLAGNIVILQPSAKIGRDVYAACDTFYLKTDLSGDLAVTAEKVIIKDATIAGNLNLSVERIEFDGNVEVKGRLTYNDNAEVIGANHLTADHRETYHVEEINPSAVLFARIYGKAMSMASLFLIMVIICLVFKPLHGKISSQTTASRFGTNLALGLGVLIAVPIVALLAFFTIVAAPLGIIALLVYIIAIYLSQGFAGLWLGHLIVERLCKIQANVYLEALVGIVILGLLSLVPLLGVATGFLALLLGLGLMISYLRPSSGSTAKSKSKRSSKTK